MSCADQDVGLQARFDQPDCELCAARLCLLCHLKLAHGYERLAVRKGRINAVHRKGEEREPAPPHNPGTGVTIDSINRGIFGLGNVTWLVNQLTHSAGSPRSSLSVYRRSLSGP